MTDKVPFKYIKACGSFYAGEVSALPQKQAERLFARDIAKPLREAPGSPPEDKRVDTPTDKSDDDAREELGRMADEARIKRALESDNYNTMRAVVADLGDGPATGSKGDMVARLEAMLEG